ncbi:uncharacterized protein BJ212DRAFT_1392246 [Suillus subaureus]|uniref:Uncharacterized protein n=1 Tax=Suillus subaureus TaxID=48587 RepID=A0A9P7DXF0_9AGAM|nr:uncharacterized protein BJ212DRAFT_1392246 [Suillus subaureus]KAG1805313.1 hypothetical protein BJ212DRAFT_1392246 [Suillus subaureus]
MLSHRWGAKEPGLHDIKDNIIYDLNPVETTVKLQRFCKVARIARRGAIHAALTGITASSYKNQSIPCLSGITTQRSPSSTYRICPLHRNLAPRKWQLEHSRIDCSSLLKLYSSTKQIEAYISTTTHATTSSLSVS